MSPLLPPQWRDAPSDNDDDPTDHAKPAGANLMGSDLYNNLIRYFVTHLKGLKEVRIPLFPATLA